MPALSVCERCGDYICLRCLCDLDGRLYCPACLAAQPTGATPGSRVAAHLIDSTVFVLPVLSLLVAVIVASDHIPTVRIFDYWILAISVPLTLALLTAVQLFFVHENGQSIGKRVMRLRVVMSNGEPANVWRVLFLRNLAPLLIGFIPMIGLIFRIANVAALYSEGNRAIHDRFANTKVVRATKRNGETQHQ